MEEILMLSLLDKVVLNHIYTTLEDTSRKPEVKVSHSHHICFTLGDEVIYIARFYNGGCKRIHIKWEEDMNPLFSICIYPTNYQYYKKFSRLIMQYSRGK